MARHSNNITKQSDIEYLCSLKEEDIVLSELFELFGEFNGKVRFNTYDTFTVPANVYGPDGKKNKSAFLTTVGLWIFNVFMIENELFDVFHYVNKPINGDTLDDLIDTISTYVMEDKLNWFGKVLE